MHLRLAFPFGFLCVCLTSGVLFFGCGRMFSDFSVILPSRKTVRNEISIERGRGLSRQPALHAGRHRGSLRGQPLLQPAASRHDPAGTRNHDACRQPHRPLYPVRLRARTAFPHPACRSLQPAAHSAYRLFAVDPCAAGYGSGLADPYHPPLFVRHRSLLRGAAVLHSPRGAVFAARTEEPQRGDCPFGTADRNPRFAGGQRGCRSGSGGARCILSPRG